ncbi:MAG: PAS domain-containing protein [Andreesenia angusta]|nr:PAS domain-containing protein [Andreesenia angusta]
MDMKKYLSEVDEEKLKLVLKIKNDYNDGKIELEEARNILKEKVKSLKPYEIALAEQELKEIEDDECRKEDIQNMLELFDGIMDTSRPELEKNHPIICYYRENDAMRKILWEIEDLIQYPVIKNQWLELYDRLAEYKLHFARKHNQLYSILEQKGFDRPTTTMWTLDNFIRDEISDARALLEADKEDEFIELQQTIVDDIKDLMEKEETVLYPTSLAMINEEEFEDMKSGDREIGFSWIEVDNMDEKSEEIVSRKSNEGEFAEELSKLLSKYGYSTDINQKFDVSTGKLTLEQINLIYKHMPVDLSYVDENDLVCFYSDTEHRVFPRSKNVIGRDVKNCHPRASVHIVEEIVEKFRNGEEDNAEFWINKPGLFIYIYYTAVRDENGKFRGVLEMMQDCTHIRNLEGSQTLLNWGSGKSNTIDIEEENTVEEEEIGEELNTNSIQIDENTKLKDILGIYPWLKDEMESINPKFAMLKTPLARVMLPKATIKMMSERTGMNTNDLIEAIKSKIENR